MNQTTDEESLSEQESFISPAPKSKAWRRAVIDSDSDSDETDAAEAVYSDFFSEEYGEENATVEDSFESDENFGSPIDKRKQSNPSEDIVETTDDDEDEINGSQNDIVDSSDNEVNLREKDKTDIVNTDEDDEVTTSVLRNSLANVEEGEFAPEKSPKVFNNSLYRETVTNTDDEIDDDSDVEQGHSEDEDHVINSDQQSSKNCSGLVEITNESPSVVEVSSDDEPAGPVLLKQTKIKTFFSNGQSAMPKNEPPDEQQIVVGEAEYKQQVEKIKQIEAAVLQAKNAMRVIKLEHLPDKGKSLVEKGKSLNNKLQEERRVLSNMVVDTSKPALTGANKVEIAWEAIEAGVDAVGPRTLGKIGVARFNAEKQLAVEALDSLHKSLNTCPSENDIVDDPKGLKVPLMAHQRRALAWLLWRENQKPSGGLLADDMGLGKTLTMISLIMKSQELEPLDEFRDKENHRSKYPGGTLVVCPASLINQWSGEIERRTKRGMLGVEIFHGTKREMKPKKLAKHDIVVTTYALVLSEHNKDGPLFGVRWRRIILDEAHQIRNHKSRTSEAVFRLSGKSRWALTGTPVHNKELDMYAILKFLRCSPFDDLQVWKHWVSDKSTGGGMRLHAVISSLMLRRTKAELIEKGALQSLPERTWELISIKLQTDEMDVYQKVLIFSRTLFAQFLHQRAEKNQDAYDMRFNQAPPDPNGEYFKMRNKLLKLNRVKEVSQHEILVLLLRLRQICCHPSLIKQMLQGDEDLGDADDEEEAEEMNLLEQLNRLNIDEEVEHPAYGLGEESVGLKEASKGYLNASNPVFMEDRRSSKINALLKILKEKVSGDDKAIVVSQWTNLLELVAIHIQNEGIPYDKLNGKIPVHKRMAIVDNFNDPKADTKVLLLSLTAGGVGLNLIGANHLFLLDLHWNPQLESQAQDRIYRMGQNKPISVYKFMAVDTIEERIKALQDKKLEIADSMLTGSKRVGSSKLTLQDLKMLFDFK